MSLETPGDKPQVDKPPVEDLETDHVYDGIREYDNPIPGWWNWLFVATIVFSMGYFCLFTVLIPNQGGAEATYQTALAENTKRQYGELGELVADNQTILKLATEEKWMNAANSIFQANCVSCHGANGEGISGANLTDNVYINVKEPADIADVIMNGRKGNAMPAWNNRLQPVEIVLLSSYVVSMRGQNIPGRAPEGEAVDEWKLDD